MQSAVAQEGGASALRIGAPRSGRDQALARWGIPLVAAAAGLWAVMAVHAAGQTLLATVLLAVTALAVWTYGSARTQALRYLFPAVAAALVFVAFPMVYTIGMGLTNQSSRNLLAEAEARRQLLAERIVDSSTQRPFELRVLEASAVVGVPALDSPVAGTVRWSAPIPRSGAPATAALTEDAPPAAARQADVRTRVEWLEVLRSIQLQPEGGTEALRVVSLREVAVARPLYEATASGGLRDRLSGAVYEPDRKTGFFTSAEGATLQPGFQVFVGLSHYARLFTEPRFREPFIGVFIWTVAFSGLTVLGAGGLGLLLACLLNWQALQGRAAYRIILFLPYAVPAFLSILVFKGLFNQNLGEINLILDGLFGIRPAWFSDPNLARLMLLLVNIWLGFPYMMVLCSGLIQSIPGDLYEASSIAGAGPWDNFRRITLPLILKPLTPLLISAFAFNFNNFVLISLLTGGRPDQLDSDVPAGTTDILVSYTWRIAFQDSGNQYGLAAAISTVIFLLVAAITLVQLRMTRMADDGSRR